MAVYRDPLEAALARADAERALLRETPLRDPTLAPHLEPGEPVLWLGRPVPWRVALRCLPGALFGAGTLALAVWISMQVATPSLFFWFFILELGLALWLLVRPLVRVWQARGTRYAITDHRAVVVTSGPFAGSRSFHDFDLDDVVLRSNRSGFGDLVFRESLGRFLSVPFWTEIGFLAVHDVRSADRALRTLRLGGSHEGHDPG